MAGESDSSRRKRLLAWGLGGLLAIGLAGFLLIYFVLFPTSSPKPFKLTPAATAQTTAAGSLGGRWSIARGSLAGYRVREKLAFLPAQSDAVGRTSQITGGATLSEASGGLTISAASFDVAVSTLTSDRSMRDEKIREIGLESDRYPTATFQLSRPLAVTIAAVSGRVAHIPATGVFVIHGVSRTQTLPVELSLSGSTLLAAGSLTFPWSRFGMTAPSVGGFVNVTDKATLEFDLRLQRS